MHAWGNQIEEYSRIDHHPLLVPQRLINSCYLITTIYESWRLSNAVKLTRYAMQYPLEVLDMQFFLLFLLLGWLHCINNMCCAMGSDGVGLDPQIYTGSAPHDELLTSVHLVQIAHQAPSSVLHMSCPANHFLWGPHRIIDIYILFWIKHMTSLDSHSLRLWLMPQLCS